MRLTHPEAGGATLVPGIMLAQAEPFEAKQALLAERTAALAELRRVHDKLRESEARFRSAFDHAAIGKALVSLEGRWLQVNRSICRILGYTEQELLVRDFQSITHPADLNADLALARRLISGEIPDYQLTKRYIHRDGHLVWGLLSVSLVRDASGAPAYFVSEVQDVSERYLAEEALRASEEEYRTTFELAGVGKAQIDVATGRFTRVNAKLCAMTGYANHELLTMTLADLAPADERAAATGAIAALQGGTVSEWSAERRFVRRDGRDLWAGVNAALIHGAPPTRPARVVATIIDVTARKAAEQLERDRRLVLEMVARDMPLKDVLTQLTEAVARQFGGGVAILALQDGAVDLHGTGLAKPWAKAMARHALPLAAALAAGTWDDAASVSVTQIRSHDAWKHLRDISAENGIEACWAIGLPSSDQTPLGLLTALRADGRAPTTAEAQTLEMAAKLATICVEHHNTTRQLSHLVRHDALTGLPNRVCFEDRLQQAMGLARRNGRQVALFVLDVDHFKEINDTLGHDAGDALLQQFAGRLSGELRETDTLARMGGDEFMLILPDLADRRAATAVAKKIVACLGRPFTFGGEDRVVTTSIGVVMFPDDGADSATLQRHADEQMYLAKRGGRNRYAVRE